MARKQTYKAPTSNPYDALIQSTDAAQQPAEQTKQRAEKKEDCYRFNAKLPIECKDYLQEMAWRHRMTITDFLAKIIMADMEAHPEWKDTVDVLNISKK